MELIIYNRKGQSFTVLHDECDEILIKNNTWHVAGGNPIYAKTNIKLSTGLYKSKFLHRLIMNVGDDNTIVVDHINRNTLDNRRNNLRICNKQGNNCNAIGNKNTTSKYKGVDWDAAKGRWRAQIQVNYKGVYLGRYKLEEEAARAYDKAAKLYHGDFANLNFPDLMLDNLTLPKLKESA